MSMPMNLSSLSVSSTLGDVFIHVCFISWAKSERFHRKVNSRCSCWFQRCVHQHWRLQTKLCKVAWNASTINSETMYRIDLRIGEVIYEFVAYNIPSFWRHFIELFRFYFFVAWQWKRSIGDIRYLFCCLAFSVLLSRIHMFFFVFTQDYLTCPLQTSVEPLLISANQKLAGPNRVPRTGGSVGWAPGCCAGGREFNSRRTNTQGL